MLIFRCLSLCRRMCSLHCTHSFTCLPFIRQMWICAVARNSHTLCLCVTNICAPTLYERKKSIKFAHFQSSTVVLSHIHQSHRSSQFSSLIFLFWLTRVIFFSFFLKRINENVFISTQFSIEFCFARFSGWLKARASIEKKKMVRKIDGTRLQFLRRY